MFKPIDRMWDRVEAARDDSDVALFYDLMKLGELVTKTAAAGMVAAVQNDRERHRYRLLYSLVRSNGLGDWSKAVQDVLKPPISEHLTPVAREEQQELTQKSKVGSWQQEALSLLDECFEQVNLDKPSGPLTGLQWLHNFAHLRNKTRGHGAQTGEALSRSCVSLEKSIQLFTENFRLFQRPWAYLHLNQSGKYRVTRITAEIGGFENFEKRSSQEIAYDNGIYVYFDQPVPVDLIASNADVRDFYYPNGNFNDKRFELISYDSGNIDEGDASPYMTPPVELPRSETTGGELDEWEACLANIPPRSTGYIERPRLEERLSEKLTRGRNEIITLAGRGGIGKTYLALSVLHKIAESGTFFYIVWFSARDVDLLASGPKPVTQDVRTAGDMAKQFVRLIDPPQRHSKGFDSLTYFRDALEKGIEGEPSLFVFDNFETVEGKREVYELINSVIRRPNRALITTRERGFTSDDAIEVGGMTKDEAQGLINSTAADLDIANLLTQDYRQQLYLESEGHPYVIKILLGEVAKSGVARKPERIMAGEEQILDALFESTYNNTLSPAAQRIFLNLSNWRSVVPQLALEAVLLRESEEGESERAPVGLAIDELYKSSFVNIRESPEDGEPFVFVPLTASLFGRRALDVSSLKNTVQADLELLYKFGATQQTDIQRGIKPKVENLFRNVESERGAFNKYLPVLEIVARRYPPAWRHMVFLYERSLTDNNLDKAKRSIEHYLQLPRQAEDEQGRMEAWKKLAELRRRTADFTGEVDALLGMCRLPGCPIEDISYSARRVLALLSQKAETYSLWSNEERRLLYGELADQMERRIRELYPNDFGYLGWLRFNRGEREKAEKFTKQGLSKNPDNEHLNNLAQKLFS